MATFGKWDRFLEAEATRPGNGRFIARNFLLDEGLSVDRVASYNRVAATDHIRTRQEWKDGHEHYLTERIRLARPAHYIVPRRIDPAVLTNCPETFGRDAAFSTLRGTDPAYDLIRVVDAEGMARFAARPRLFVRVVEEYLALQTEEARQEISAAVSFWLERRDLRPIFAAFWHGVGDLIDGGGTDWADRLRDRMGLIRFNPAGGGRTPVLIFRYPVRLVPKIANARADSRALAVPTVLDGEWSEAFCPAPAGQVAGFAVDLSAGLDHRAHEVVHPYVRFGVEHLYRIGYICKRVPDDLSEARRWHLLFVQDACRRADYACMTDGDLL